MNNSDVIEFSFTKQPDAHQKFQEWRRNNPNAFFLNCKSKKMGIIHRVDCRHPGDTTWEPSEEYGNLCSKPKVCSLNESALSDWAHSHGYNVKRCADCA